MMTIISGGQVGVDRAALDAALAHGYDIGGYVPKGRRCEDGPLDKKYTGMVETESDKYPPRTRKNIEASDVTIILVPTAGHKSPGTELTKSICREVGRDTYVATRGDVVKCAEWILEREPLRINCAGPRAKKNGESMYNEAYRFFLNLFEMIK